MQNNILNRPGSDEKFLDRRKIIAIIKKNWLVLKGDKLRLVPLILFPLVMVFLFGYTAGTTPKYTAAAIVDYDSSNISEFVKNEIYSNDLFSVKYIIDSQDQGKKLIENGQIKILFIIPQNFAKDVENGKTAYINVITDESDPSVAQVTKASTNIFIQGLSGELLKQKLNGLGLSAQGIKIKIQELENKIEDSNKDSLLAASSEASMESTFKNTKTLTKNTADDISNKIDALKTSIAGVPLDPNEISSTYSEGNVVSYKSVYDIMTASDRQGYIEEQIGVHQGFGTVNNQFSRYTAKLYSDAKTIDLAYQNQMINTKNLKSDLAGLEKDTAVLVRESENIPISAVSVLQIEPYGTGRRGLDFMLPNILALIIFQGAVVGLGRAIAGERKDGSLTRVFLTPTSNVTIIAGTQLFYMIIETIRSSLIVFIAAALFGVLIKGSMIDVLVIICIYALGATGVGMLLSVMAKSQEQYMALSMIVTLPMMFLGGVFFPIQTMPPILQGVTKILPLTYAADALRGIMIKGFTLGQIIPDITFLIGFGVVTIGLSTLIFKRELI